MIVWLYTYVRRGVNGSKVDEHEALRDFLISATTGNGLFQDPLHHVILTYSRSAHTRWPEMVASEAHRFVSPSVSKLLHLPLPLLDQRLDVRNDRTNCLDTDALEADEAFDWCIRH